jgi:formate dehydrogenase subunit gamma
MADRDWLRAVPADDGHATDIFAFFQCGVDLLWVGAAVVRAGVGWRPDSTMPDHIAWQADKAADIIAAGAREPGAMLPILQALQAVFGHVPEAAIPMVAEALNVTRAEVHGIVSFYHDFRRAPAGKRVLKLCRAEACQSMGGEALAAAAQAALGVGWGATSADGAVTLEPVYCLGLCATAPAALLDEQPVGRLDGARLAALLDQARQ